MAPETFALADQPVLMALMFILGAVLGIMVERMLEKQKRAERSAFWKGRNSIRRKGNVLPIGNKVPTEAIRQASAAGTSATEQLACVMGAKFSSRPLLNRPEANLFKALDAAVVARNPGWQVMAQVSLGEFISSTDKDAYGCVNSKRVDFALMDPDARVIHAIEYQGSGHHLEGGTAAARDAVKKEALRKAGIGYHEVVAGHTTAGELKRLVEKLVPGGQG